MTRQEKEVFSEILLDITRVLDVTINGLISERETIYKLIDVINGQQIPQPKDDR